MIIDQLRHAGLYHGLGENLKQAFDYLAAHDFSAMASGRYDIAGDTVFALVQRYDTKPREQGLWEAHRRYIDVQFVAFGIESLGWAPLGNLTETQPYSAEKDYLLFAGAGDVVTARAGDFLVFFPEDAHMPCLAYDQPAPVLKVVVKVLAE
jgi:YhcH/YjgK/YiaL family protein